MERPRGFLRQLGRLSLWAGGLGLVGSTLYLAVVAVLWNAQVGDLIDVRQDLKSQLAAAESALEEATAGLDATQSRLDENLASLSSLANDKAQARDFQYLFEDLALAMADCANEEDEVVQLVVTYRDLRAIKPYQDAVKDYCDALSVAFSDLAAEAEGAMG